MRSPDVASLPAILTTATVFMMDIATAALAAVAGRQRQLRRFSGKKSPSRVLVRGPAAGGSRLDADRMERIRDAVNLHRPPGVLQFRLHAFPMQP